MNTYIKNNKKQFHHPEMEIIEITEVDVITDSPMVGNYYYFGGEDNLGGF